MAWNTKAWKPESTRGSGGHEWVPTQGAGGARWDGLLTSQNVVSLCEEARI